MFLVYLLITKIKRPPLLFAYPYLLRRYFIAYKKNSEILKISEF